MHGNGKGPLGGHGDLGKPLTSQGTLLAPEDLIKVFQTAPASQEGVNTFETHFQNPRTGVKTRAHRLSLSSSRGTTVLGSPGLPFLTPPSASIQSPASSPRGISY